MCRHLTRNVRHEGAMCMHVGTHQYMVHPKKIYIHFLACIGTNGKPFILQASLWFAPLMNAKQIKQKYYEVHSKY